MAVKAGDRIRVKIGAREGRTGVVMPKPLGYAMPKDHHLITPDDGLPGSPIGPLPAGYLEKLPPRQVAP